MFYLIYSRHLCIKFPPSSSWELQDVLTEWQRVSWWKWAGQMSSEVDRNRYWEILSHALKKYLGQDSSVSVSDDTDHVASGFNDTLPLFLH